MLEPLGLTILALFAALILADLLRPARSFVRIPFWRLKGVAFFALYLAIATYLPLVWDGWLGEHRLIDATSLGTVGGAVVGFLVLELGIYAWHRLLHGSDLLWRYFHQMHHSAERHDVFGAFYFSPLDMAGFTLVGSLSLVLVLGISGPAAAIVSFLATLCAMFQHANVRTPRWLGYLVQRPESHAIHHQRGIHRHNYSDLPLWDMVFGTFQNPAEWSGECGFQDGASRRVAEMLRGKDLSREPVAV